MDFPVIVGVIIIVVLLVSFSEWFYGVSKGINGLVINDRWHSYRIFSATILSIIFMFGMFFVISMINECPNEEREGIFSNLRCQEYLTIRAAGYQLFQPQDKVVDQTLE